MRAQILVHICTSKSPPKFRNKFYKTLARVKARAWHARRTRPPAPSCYQVARQSRRHGLVCERNSSSRPSRCGSARPCASPSLGPGPDRTTKLHFFDAIQDHVPMRNGDSTHRRATQVGRRAPSPCASSPHARPRVLGRAASASDRLAARPLCAYAPLPRPAPSRPPAHKLAAPPCARVCCVEC